MHVATLGRNAALPDSGAMVEHSTGRRCEYDPDDTPLHAATEGTGTGAGPKPEAPPSRTNSYTLATEDDPSGLAAQEQRAVSLRVATLGRNTALGLLPGGSAPATTTTGARATPFGTASKVTPDSERGAAVGAINLTRSQSKALNKAVKAHTAALASVSKLADALDKATDAGTPAELLDLEALVPTPNNMPPRPAHALPSLEEANEAAAAALNGTPATKDQTKAATAVRKANKAAQKAAANAESAKAKALRAGVPEHMVLEALAGVTGDQAPTLHSASREVNTANLPHLQYRPASGNTGARAGKSMSVMFDMDVGDSSCDNYDGHLNTVMKGSIHEARRAQNSGTLPLARGKGHTTPPSFTMPLHSSSSSDDVCKPPSNEFSRSISSTHGLSVKGPQGAPAPGGSDAETSNAYKLGQPARQDDDGNPTLRLTSVRRANPLYLDSVLYQADPQPAGTDVDPARAQHGVVCAAIQEEPRLGGQDSTTRGAQEPPALPGVIVPELHVGASMHGCDGRDNASTGGTTGAIGGTGADLAQLGRNTSPSATSDTTATIVQNDHTLTAKRAKNVSPPASGASGGVIITTNGHGLHTAVEVDNESVQV